MLLRINFLFSFKFYFIFRYDYEECESEKAAAMMSHLRSQLDSQSLIGQTLSAGSGEGYTVSVMDDFEYTDPIDKSVTKNQVI